VIAVAGVLGCFVYRCIMLSRKSNPVPNLEDLSLDDGDDIMITSPTAGASLPHPDEIRASKEITGPSSTRAEVKVSNSQDEEDEEGEII